MKLRRAIVLTCVVALIASLLPGFPAQADQNDTVYVSKHISLLYDNSGSMSQAIQESDGSEIPNRKWCYASYAAQVFTGLLNEKDSLSITFMNNLGVDSLELDLQGNRQNQVTKVLNATDKARSGTPFSRVSTALEKLIPQGLKSDAELGTAQVDESQQYWLVLTTDGRFNNDWGTSYSKQDVIAELISILEEYSELQLVYFGIGTEGDNSNLSAFDFRSEASLTSYPNFFPYYAESEKQIVSTMQELSNRISGRYDVKEDVSVSGSTVTIRISGESSPIRNVAVLAQQTNARLTKAVAQDGTELEISRYASIAYPYNDSYKSSKSDCNMPAGTMGGYTAMITSPTGKIPEGTVTLTFSDPVNANGLSLMYEPAIQVQLLIQKKVGSDWVDVPMSGKVSAGDTLRVQYQICEDGSSEPLDEKRLPGKSEALFTCGDKTIQPGETFTVPAGNTTLTASVSLMDGDYKINTSRTIQAVEAGDYKVTVTDPLTILDTELAENTLRHVDFTVQLGNAALTEKELADFRVDSGSLQGTVSTPGRGVLRFTPKHSDCNPGDYPITLYYGNTAMASQTVSVITTTYSATASGNLSLINDQLAENRDAVTFEITVHQGSESRALTQGEAESGEFRLDTGSLQGSLSTKGGKFTFLPNDPDTPVGDYPLTLYHKEQVLAKATVTVLPVSYTAKADQDLEIIDAALEQNTEKITFTVTAHRDGKEQPITKEEAALFQIAATGADGAKLEGKTAFDGGKLTFTPGGNAPAGDYTVALTYESATLAQATVTIIPDPVTYSAEADRDLTLFSNEIGFNQEAIIFTLTAHRTAGDSPITAEEQSKFRMEAVTEDGSKLQGTCVWDPADPSRFCFTPVDPQGAVGTYTLTLYQGDAVLATSTVTILQYNAQYTVEVHVPDPNEVRRFGLLDNQTAVAFVIYADGVPCPETVLRTMLQEMIAVTHTPTSPLMKLSVTTGKWEGMPAVLVRPVSWTRCPVMDFVSRTIGALGLLPAGDLDLTLTVDAPKGDAGTGQLTLTYTVLEQIFYLILLAVFLLLLVLLGMLIYSNWRMPRFYPGKLVYYKVNIVNGKYYPTMPITERLSFRIYFRLLPLAESITFQGLTFTANTGNSPLKVVNFTVPQCVLAKPRGELRRYYFSASTPLSKALLTLLRTRTAGEIPKQALNANLPKIPVVTSAPHGTAAQEVDTHTFNMREGSYILRKGESIEVWTYIPQ